jgi:hypothetical protein
MNCETFIYQNTFGKTNMNNNYILKHRGISQILNLFIVIYFLTVNVFAQTIIITNPNSGSLKAGTTQSITWTSTGSISNIKLEYTTDLGESWNTIASSVSAGSGSYQWVVPNLTAYECKIKITSPDNNSVQSSTAGVFIIYPEPKPVVEPLIPVSYPTFMWPLNAYYPVTTPTDDQGINGRVGNACGPTAVANLLWYWQYPRKGTGARSFTDHLGCTWSADFGQTEYLYDRMPNPIAESASQSQYDAIATLMYHAGTGMHDIWRTGAREGVINAFKTYFGYSQKVKFLYRGDYTPEQWDKIFKTELSFGRPIIIGGDGGPLPEGGVAGHWFICDGYNSESLYHVQYNYSNISGYMPLYEFKPYHVNNWALVYLQPELNGKKLTITSPNGDENWQQGTMKTITWTGSGVENIQIEYSTDKGWNWQILASNVPAAAGSYKVTIPAVVAEQCLIRISDQSNINVYDKSDAIFRIYDTKELRFASQFFAKIQAGISLPIRWNFKGINNCIIEYSSNGGNTWNNIIKKPASEKAYIWQVPQTITQNAKIRIYDESDPSFITESNLFSIISTSLAGGPYINDANTVVLMHFNMNYENTSNPNTAVELVRLISFSDNFDLGLDYGARIDNSAQVSSCIIIPNESSFNLQDNWTIEAWFKIKSWGSGNVAYPYLLFKGDLNYYVDLSPQNGSLFAGYDFDGGAERISLPGNILQTDKWYHIAFIKNSSNNTLRCILRNASRNIIADVSANYNPLHIPKNSSGNISIGGVGGGSNVQFDGYVDEIRISNIARDFSAATANEKGESVLPAEYSLMQNYPNPFNPSTKIRFSLPQSSFTRLAVYDILGKELVTLVNGELNAGQHEVEFNAAHLASGIYFYRITAGRFSDCKKLMLLK